MNELGSVGITSVSIAPLRAIGSDLSEQVSQSIAGEPVVLLQNSIGYWVKVRTLTDSYVGWADRRHFEFNIDYSSKSSMLRSTMSIWKDKISGTKLWLPAGALLTSTKGGEYRFAGTVVVPDDIESPLGEDQVSLSISALKFLNAPYQWGGRTVSGIDCSGLSQIAAKLNGIEIPRDASQQVKSGYAVDWDRRIDNDLAFFENKDGAITHVGILTSMDSIIHASGYVRVDPITANGIFNVEEDRISHKLTCLRRLG